jgi:hypothetical protein
VVVSWPAGPPKNILMANSTTYGLLLALLLMGISTYGFMGISTYGLLLVLLLIVSTTYGNLFVLLMVHLLMEGISIGENLYLYL